MPNLSFHIQAETMPPAECLAALSLDCIELCTKVLEAELRNVHVVYLAVRLGHGHPVFAELRYRHEPFRPPEVMNRFLDELEGAIVRHTGLLARIRCFAYAASDIYARN
ncbi:hypothetical protein [Burkholderia gladioli]|jgi:hypothetical protein|uniref:Uncharacterized protein n=1 Tax=Burkholderia gladioli TaxID=28095 RepID=A0AB38TY16_BURGA|nr:hypothetical protein [Burkholderia gladioli]ATF87468.1 hypothetical protein CO712_20345 [Burkholderia gladioli pv. gladioli]KAF1060293.1 hypothetical protein LvStA_06896 [Burkholderia gladioli]KKJ08153.1 hypothetical protein XF14_01035 [Burkholderia gladioli]MBA1364083.1 hypothetical protein [Burkholderia gladioli]MBJ9679214.1 hypothetical protein [Burkholderia gladioli]